MPLHTKYRCNMCMMASDFMVLHNFKINHKTSFQRFTFRLGGIESLDDIEINNDLLPKILIACSELFEKKN